MYIRKRADSEQRTASQNLEGVSMRRGRYGLNPWRPCGEMGVPTV